MTVKLLTEHHLEFLNIKGGYKGSSEFTLVKMPHCLKPHATAYIIVTHLLRVLIFLQWLQHTWRGPACHSREVEPKSSTQPFNVYTEH